MSYIIEFDHSDVPQLHLPVATALYMGNERSDLEAGLRERAIGFRILDANDKEIVSGRYFGSDRDRGWPLHCVRFYARGGVDAVTLTYADGQKFAWHSEWQQVEPVQADGA